MRSILMVGRTTPEMTELAQRLEQEDYLVLTAEHRDDAVESLTALLPGAILIDLPLSQSRRLIRQLRASPQLRGIARLLVVEDSWTTALPPVAAGFHRPVDADHLIRALPALYPRPITMAAFQAPQPGQREERIQQALVHLLEPAQLPETVPVPASARALAVAASGHHRRSRRRAQQQAPQQGLA